MSGTTTSTAQVSARTLRAAGRTRRGTGQARTAVPAVSHTAVRLSTLLIENPVHFRARWAYGRTGAADLTATLAAVTVLWTPLPGHNSAPVPREGHSPGVDIRPTD
ncbi:hypothetical protein [Streptomyces litmocidini]|uniref:Transposase n=1 Tax=Streptomyces litmocidini TaxID=67318 RepID=A0ABW7UGB8_9ACTN